MTVSYTHLGVRIIKMELGEPDASGRRSPVEIPGSEYEMDCDTAVSYTHLPGSSVAVHM